MKKKYIAWLMAAAMTLTGNGASMVMTYAQTENAASTQTTVKLVEKGSCGSNATYRLYSNGHLKIQGKGEVRTYDFSEKAAKIKKVTVASGITGIGSYTFNRCQNLKSVSLPKTLKSIGNSVFTDTAITSIQLPSGLKSIGAYAFYRCKLTSLNIPESVTMIDEYALSYCDNLAFVSVTGSVKEIPESLFEGDKKLKKVTLKQGVKKIGRNAFCGSGLTSMTFPESLTDIESQAFSLCPNLAKVTFPGKLTEIGSSAFYACRKLSAVTIPTSVKRIGTEAFNDCRAMKKIIFLNGKTILDGKPMGYNWENEKNRALVIVGKNGSTAQTYAKKNGLKFQGSVALIKTTKLTGVPKTKILSRGKTFTIKATASPKNTDEKITYKSSNTKIATVTSKGVVKGLRKGKATITVQSGSKKMSCKVTVK